MGDGVTDGFHSTPFAVEFHLVCLLRRIRSVLGGPAQLPAANGALRRPPIPWRRTRRGQRRDAAGPSRGAGRPGGRQSCPTMVPAPYAASRPSRQSPFLRVQRHQHPFPAAAVTRGRRLGSSGRFGTRGRRGDAQDGVRRADEAAHWPSARTPFGLSPPASPFSETPSSIAFSPSLRRSANATATRGRRPRDGRLESYAPVGRQDRDRTAAQGLTARGGANRGCRMGRSARVPKARTQAGEGGRSGAQKSPAGMRRVRPPRRRSRRPRRPRRRKPRRRRRARAAGRATSGKGARGRGKSAGGCPLRASHEAAKPRRRGGRGGGGPARTTRPVDGRNGRPRRDPVPAHALDKPRHRPSPPRLTESRPPLVLLDFPLRPW